MRIKHIKIKYNFQIKFQLKLIIHHLSIANKQDYLIQIKSIKMLQ